MAGCISKPRRGRAGLAACVLFAGVVCPGADKGAGKVTDVRFWSLGESTRVAIEVSTDFKFRSERLNNPDRLFFDIQDARPEMGPRGLFTVPVGDTLLKQIRVAETQPGVTRVVLDLAQRVEFTASQLSTPNRLMIELRAKDPPLPTDPPRATLAKKPVETPIATPESSKPAPKRFDPPPPREEKAEAPAKPALLPPPTLPMLNRPVRAPSTGSAASAVKRDIPPPGDSSAAAASRQDTESSAGVPLKAASTARGTEAAPAKHDSNGDRSLTRVLGLKLGRVVLDPGHGGHDTGTRGPSGLYEKDIVLDVSQRLGVLLESRLGSAVYFTRRDDTYVALEERTRLANDYQADLFLSVHVNSSPVRAVSGVETYYLNFTTSKAALDVAARENASSSRSIFELKDLLQKIALKDKIDESREFATRLQTALYNASAKGNAAARNRGVKKAPFVVLIGANMPSVLSEIGFLSNSSDEALLRKGEQRQKIAEALYKGIASYADTLSHFQVAKKQE